MAELVVDAQHHHRVVLDGMLKATRQPRHDDRRLQGDARPAAGQRAARRRRSSSSSAGSPRKGVEIRLLHAGTPSSAALRELKRALPASLTIRRCPRLHAKAVIVDCARCTSAAPTSPARASGAKADGQAQLRDGHLDDSPALIDGVLEQFNALWEGCRCVNVSGRTSARCRWKSRSFDGQSRARRFSRVACDARFHTPARRKRRG